MTLLTDIRNFFVRERLWGFLFLLAAAIYGTALWKGRAEVQEPPSSALEMLKTAEHKLKEEIHSVGGVQMLLRRRPRLLTVLNLFTFLVFGIFLTGLWIDYYWVTRPAWRQGLGKAAGPPEAAGACARDQFTNSTMRLQLPMSPFGISWMTGLVILAASWSLAMI